MNNLEPTLKIYLAGVIFSFLLNVLFLILNPKVTVKNLIGYIVNIAASWVCPLTIVADFTCSLLAAKGLNKTLWTNNRVSSDPKQRVQGLPHRKHIR